MRQADLRQRLLRAAEQEIATSGPAKASLRGIARRVGVSHQATAHHFDDRAGLFTALAVEGFELLLEETVAAIEAVGTEGVASGSQVAASGAAYVAFAMRHPTMFDVMFRPELLHVDDPRLVDVRRLHRELLVQIIATAQAEGWGTAVPTEELATVGWATVHGLAVLQRDAQLVEVMPEIDPGLLQRVARSLDALA
jgi:AcrR family transcriptional regulator